MKGITSHLKDLISIADRTDIASSEKRRLMAESFRIKFRRGSGEVRFLGYRVSSGSQTNTVSILREIFLLGDYAFKTESAAPRIIDAGANIGVATLFFKRYFPRATVLSVEAAPENFKRLETNIRQNGLEGVTAVFGALGKTVGTRDFYFDAKSPGGSTGSHDVAASKKRNEFSKVTVPAIRLSDHIHEEVDLLKMDVEGGEGEILADLDETDKLGLIRQMVFEYHANESNSGNDLGEILQILKRNGFSVVIYDSEGGHYGRYLEPFPKYHFMIRAYRMIPA